MINQQIRDLIDISRHYGASKDFVIAGGGNTSYKDEKRLWIKASGTGLATIDHDGFVIMDRTRLGKMPGKRYSSDPELREQQVKADLYACCEDPETRLRPSVETNLHDIIDYSFVVHLHPTLVNGLLCGNNSPGIAGELFKDALYLPYTDPGYTLFCKVHDEIKAYRNSKGYDPQIIFLENHGVFVSANSIGEIKDIYTDIFIKIKGRLDKLEEFSEIPVQGDVTEFLPAVRMLLSKDELKTLSLRNNSLITHFCKDRESYARVAAPFTPDIIVYCKSEYLYIEESGSPEEVIESLQRQIPAFVAKNGYFPQIVMIRDYGLLAAGDSWQSANTSLDVFEDLMKISLFSDSFGGPRFMSDRQIAFIDSWEVENYRRQVAKGEMKQSVVKGRIAIVTGGAMGFGAGIASSLYDGGANVVIADISEDEGRLQVERLNLRGGKQRAVFIRSDAGNPESVRSLIRQTVETFGGLDLMVSNAGILYAGSLEEMSEEIFERVTRVNYSGYFHCAKYASAVMRLQNRYNAGHFSDIVQINSKSGLRGSNRNFAYAGGKFGGIGLTQSFALELMQFNIKVNAICPGNFFEGPLWSDPEKGLFVQYLRAGKVPGAKSVDDVRRHYELQVPAGRGCRVEDIMKALYYIIDQKYETGQAVPVTGGQNMLH
jgi:NAD(P)-dependent dehydrogenase (short-subunit alcohol dehydrogenase family)/rhamnose utilization protein RhaD (predicted bifunctional aldolase and dehydrogenase)